MTTELKMTDVLRDEMAKLLAEAAEAARDGSWFAYGVDALAVSLTLDREAQWHAWQAAVSLGRADFAESPRSHPLLAGTAAAFLAALAGDRERFDRAAAQLREAWAPAPPFDADAVARAAAASSPDEGEGSWFSSGRGE